MLEQQKNEKMMFYLLMLEKYHHIILKPLTLFQFKHEKIVSLTLTNEKFLIFMSYSFHAWLVLHCN